MPKQMSDKSVFSTAYRNYVLLLLAGVYMAHTLDRSIVAMLLEPIGNEFELDDTQRGIIGGLSFGAAFALTCIPLGMIIDRFRRNLVLPVIVMVWSVMTAITGTAQTYLGLVAVRAAVGAAEAGGNPGCSSLLSDIFPSQSRATAIGIMLIGAAAGTSLAAAVGATIAADHGWRMACFAAAIPGLIFALLILFTVREPRRGAFESSAPTQPEPIGAATRFLLSQRTVIHLFIGMTLATGCLSALSAWAAPFFIRAYGLDLKTAGFALALTLGPGVALGTLMSGLLSDWLGGENPSKRLFVSTIFLSISAPAAAAILLTDDYRVASALLLVTVLFGSSYLAPGSAMLMNVTRPNIRGFMLSARQVIANLCGFALGPFIVGRLSDMFGGGTALGPALISIVCTLYLWSAFHFWVATRHVDRDIARAVTPVGDVMGKSPNSPAAQT